MHGKKHRHMVHVRITAILRAENDATVATVVRMPFGVAPFRLDRLKAEAVLLRVDTAFALTLLLAEGPVSVGRQQIRMSRSSTCTDDLSWRPEPASARKIATKGTVLLDHGAGEPSGCSCGRPCRRRQVEVPPLQGRSPVKVHGNQPLMTTSGVAAVQSPTQKARYAREQQTIFPALVVGFYRVVLAGCRTS